MTWSLSVPSVPCEQFKAAAESELAKLHLDDAQRHQAELAIGFADQVRASEAIVGVRFAAHVSGHAGPHGQGITIHVNSSAVAVEEELNQ